MSPFEGLLGNTCELRVLEHLLATPRLDFNITELQRLSGVSRTSVDRVTKKFLDWGIVRIVDTRGNMNFYSLNGDSRIVESVYDFNDSILESISPGLSQLVEDETQSLVSSVEIVSAEPPRYELGESIFDRTASKASPLVATDRTDWCVAK